jgi:hypothetical protein
LHFIDLCEMLGLPHPAEADCIGERFTFEKPVSKVYGGYGFADVWRRDHFAWEYKERRGKKHKDLKAAYKQLNDYREDLAIRLYSSSVTSIDSRFTPTLHLRKNASTNSISTISDAIRSPLSAHCLHSKSCALFSTTQMLCDPVVQTHMSLRKRPRYSLVSPSVWRSKSEATPRTPSIPTRDCALPYAPSFLPLRRLHRSTSQSSFRNLIQSDDRFQPKKVSS